MDSNVLGEHPIEYVCRYSQVAKHLSDNPPAATSTQPSDLKRGDIIVLVHSDGEKRCWLHGRIENVLPCGDLANVHIAHPCHRRYVTGDTNIKYDFLGRAIQISLSAVEAMRCDDDAAAMARHAESIIMQAQNGNNSRCHPFSVPVFIPSPYAMPSMSPFGGCYPRHQTLYPMSPYFRTQTQEMMHQQQRADAIMHYQQQFYCSPAYATVVSSPSPPVEPKKRRPSTTEEGPSKRSNTPPREELSEFTERNLADSFEDNWEFDGDLGLLFVDTDAPGTSSETHVAETRVDEIAVTLDNDDDELFIAAPQSAENGNASLADGDDDFDI